MQSILLLLLILISIYSCAQNKTNNKISPSEINKKYNFKPLSYTPIPEGLKEELLIPFYKNGKYYFSNYEGEIIDQQAWSDIRFIKHQFFWGKKDTSWYLYRLPDQLLIDRPFTNEEIKSILLDVEQEHPTATIYSIVLKKTIDLSEVVETSTENAEVTALSYKENLVTLKEKYYFSELTQEPVTISYLAPDQSALRQIQEFKKSNFSKETGVPYIRTLNTSLDYCLINKKGEVAFQNCFHDIKPLNQHFVALVNKEGKMALGNVQTNTVYKFLSDNIQTVYPCTQTFKASIQEKDTKQWYQLNADGSYIVISSSDEIACKKDQQDRQKTNEQEDIKRKATYFKKDGKYGVKGPDGNTILEPSLQNPPTILNDIGWICIKERPEYGILDFTGNWVFPMENRRVFYAGNAAYQRYSFELYEKEYRCIFNEKMELLLEKPFIFLPIEQYEWMAIDEELRPDNKEQLRRPLLFQPFYVLSHKGYGHIFTADGTYISSHKGNYNENISLMGLPRSEQYRFYFVPIGMFVDNGTEYYVRLTDGFEYRE